MMQAMQSSQVVKAIRKIVRAIDLRSREVSRMTGLTIPQIIVLQGIRDLGEVTTKALSDNADLSSATVVTILDKLEEKSLIQRYRSVSDRRIVHARLTQKGTEVASNLPGLLHDEFERKFDNLKAEERANLVASIEQIAEMMNAHKLDASPILMTGKVSG
ncbi:MarR family winged helix-turn-helix transcriptional regulator [Roseibium aggregatum]|jgi:DNA-binding MarR family transcriptional regulator|uniref:Transcriptional regulator, MarR family protein n=2 Tax=Roseibium aggregatum TaxID=187304 RepID=A0P459_ROSAI|nr:transcriptional regulator, MarR family protein [Stappia aggregata IAM 12614] [Roseibium aggregatum IAM 12614]